MRSRRRRQHPVGLDGADVLDDLAVRRPHQLDGLPGADARAARVASGAEPVVLRCASGARTDAGVRRAVEGAAQDVVPARTRKRAQTIEMSSSRASR